MIAVASLDRLQRYINTPVTHTPHVPRCKPRHEKRERYVNSKPRSTNNVAAQHRPPLRATSIWVSVSVRVCAAICAGMCNEPCLLTQFSGYSAAETCRLQACACRWQQWRKMSWKRHIRYVQLQLYYTSASGNYKRVKKRQGKNCWNTFTFWADRLLRLKTIDESANMHITFARTDYGQLADPRIRLMSNTCASSAGRNEGRGTWQCETALCSSTHTYLHIYISLNSVVSTFVQVCFASLFAAV